MSESDRLTEVGQQAGDLRVAVGPVVGHDPPESRHVHQRLSEPHELGHLFPSRVRGRDEIDESVHVVGAVLGVRAAVVVRRAAGRRRPSIRPPRSAALLPERESHISPPEMRVGTRRSDCTINITDSISVTDCINDRVMSVLMYGRHRKKRY